MRIRALILLLVLVATDALAAIPQRAYRYFPLLREEHSRVWPESDICIIAEQINHESAWKMTATRRESSGAVSYGPLQVLDATFEELRRKHPTLLDQAEGPAALLRARWGIRAGILYDRQMWQLVSFARNERERWAFALAAYNGGYGWVLRDRKLARQAGYDPDRWFGHVELFSARSRESMQINRRYPREILAGAEHYRGIL